MRKLFCGGPFGPCRQRHWGCLGRPCGWGGPGDIRDAFTGLGTPCL